MFCASCGSAVTDGAQHCRTCGARVAARTSSPSRSWWRRQPAYAKVLVVATPLVAVVVVAVVVGLTHAGSQASVGLTAPPELPGVTAPPELLERVSAWNDLLESIAEDGDNRTNELAAFLSGTPEQVSKAAADCQEEWSGAGRAATLGAVIPDTVTISKIEMSEDESKAAVMVTEEVRVPPDGLRARRVDVTTWTADGGHWCRTAVTMPCLIAAGQLPITQGAHLDGLVWAVETIQEYPAMAPLDSMLKYLVITFSVRNRDTQTRWVDDYVLGIYGPDGYFCIPTTTTTKVLPGAIEGFHTELSYGEQRSFSLVYPFGSNDDIANIRFQIVPISEYPAGFTWSSS